MAAAFYLVLALFSDEVRFNPLWLIVGLIFSSREAKTVYKYTTDSRLDGKPAG